MCLIFVAHQVHPRYGLVVAANRDEFHERPTAPAAFWEDDPRILAGRDLKGGGTWMGVTRDRRFAAVTNFRGGKTHRPTAPSRGELVTGFLSSTIAPSDYVTDLEATAETYNGFSLLASAGAELCFISNHDGEPQTLQPGVYGLSNHLLDTSWPKVQIGKAKLERLLDVDPMTPDSLLDMMHDTTPASDEHLPETGIGKDRERLLSSLFINAAGYGTRSSTALLVERDGTRGVFVERTFDGNGCESGTVRHEF